VVVFIKFRKYTEHSSIVKLWPARVSLIRVGARNGDVLARVSAPRIGSESVPIQLAQCWFPGPATSNAKILINFQIKYTEAILSNSTRKLLWFEITKMLIAVSRNKFIVSFIIIYATLSFRSLPLADIDNLVVSGGGMRSIECPLKAKFHYTGPTGHARTRTEFLGDPGRKKVRAGPVGPV